MAKEGIGLVASIAAAAVIFTIISLYATTAVAWIFAGIGWLFLFFVIYFFRDPDRSIPSAGKIIVSPGDGKVIEISEVQESSFLKSKARKVSIFLSVFDVHVNRIPMSGEVRYFNYARGKFVQAFRPEASTTNEQTVIGIQNGETRILFKQIAGILARRIVCNVREGDKVKMGDRFGLIKFGSRIDVFMPIEAEICVKLNQKVKGGEVVLGKLYSQ